MAQQEKTSVALLLIDIQEFYYPGGMSELVNSREAGDHARQLLDKFRAEGLPVIHVRHQVSEGGAIHNDVRPFDGEKIVTKSEVNCFLYTDLLDYLMSLEVETLVIAGMQTHMCVEAAVRAAHDLGYNIIVAEDACATSDLRYDDVIISARDVHFSTIVSLKQYAAITTTKNLIDNFPF
ncbi:cysteine hydrolase [Marinilabiliaceae bacterium JC017]|nr:cysteine hydrolase [Marinilabiliaceae bacterium JC017]